MFPAVLAGGLVAVLAPLSSGGATEASPEPTAHDPRFGSKQHWPNLAGNEAFVKETWPKARLLVWAHPGESGSWGRGRADLDASAAENWLQDGRPASTPPDESTDVLIPAADWPYFVGQKHKIGLPFRTRHVTVERNARVAVNPVLGNVWIKKGACFHVTGFGGRALKITGSARTFFRDDNDPAGWNRNTGELAVGQWLLVEKYKGGSVEFVGYVSALDELKVNEGLAIVGPDSCLTVGTASVQIVGPEAHLALMSGGYFGKRGNAGTTVLDVLVKGRLTGGLPDRPLARDATLGLSYKLQGLDSYRGDDTRSSGLPGGTPVGPAALGPFSLVLEQEGAILVHTSDPARARLRIEWHGAVGQKDPPDVPREISLVLLGRFNGSAVVIDHVARRGIQLPRADAWKAWKDVTFGPDNAASGQDLFVGVDEAARMAARRPAPRLGRGEED